MKLGCYSYVLWGNRYDIPYREMILSIAPICDEIVIITDPRFNDGTSNALKDMRIRIPQLQVYDYKLDLDNPGIDGDTKARARSYCDSPILLQMDADEVLHDRDQGKIKRFISDWGRNTPDIVSTGVVNWFNGDHLKMSAAGWIKERLSRNSDNITHGIPMTHRIFNGKYNYARPGTDGAGYISNRGIGLNGIPLLCNFNNFPSDYNNDSSVYIHHYSWYSLPRKWEMKTTWHYMWGLLYGKYSDLEHYHTNMDNEPVDFWDPEVGIKKDYIPAIRDEMKEKSICKAPAYITHPIIMTDWIKRQRVWYKRFMRKPISHNL